MDQVVVEVAGESEVVEEGGAVGVPGHEVVGVAPFEWRVAAGEDAAAVSFAECFALAGSGVSEEFGDAEGLDGAVFVDLVEQRGDACVAEESVG